LTFAADDCLSFPASDRLIRNTSEAFELVRREILTAAQRRQEVNETRDELTVDEYLFEYFKPTFMLYRNHAEATRLMKRMTAALEKMTPPTWPALGFLRPSTGDLLTRTYRQLAAEHRAVADQALLQSADEYRRYFAVRQELLKSLEERDFEESKAMLQGVAERDSLLELRRF
jgi:hypothetical protein